jgi:putative tryptophan/tyrosine transport system substrate-binding protein
MTPEVNRREFITLLGGTAVALPPAARAQQGTPVVGVLRVNPKGSDIFAEPFGRYMQAAGWVEGRNVHYDFVWADMRIERMHALANELVARNVDLIVTSGDPAIGRCDMASPSAWTRCLRGPACRRVQTPWGRRLPCAR